MLHERDFEDHRTKRDVSLSWLTVATPSNLPPPCPLTIQTLSLAPRHRFPEHSCRWHQVVCALEGTLTVNTSTRSFVVSPGQAAWLPAGLSHQIGSLLGAELCSIWIEDVASVDLPAAHAVLPVSPLLKALILEATAIEGSADSDDYAPRVRRLILDQLRRTRTLSSPLPWPRSGLLLSLCEALYTDPADPRSFAEWSKSFGMSSQTLARRFEAEMGLSLRSWRHRLRLFRAIEMLAGGLSVTQTAADLGYGSASAFVYAFRAAQGSSPHAYMRQRSSS
ncbi:MAG TPA: helix-turn-helix transcriptional regulator [Bosea sp. (in: a-proteobacteria)]|jgi:AraC-like DNA-binding protein/mannose-6-phosphate isomerase-like protein (cupin superfamily)|nr:helix-turn-helix transcriptional regulator [Bosea sp. (in: a-proteobacteria)]